MNERMDGLMVSLWDNLTGLKAIYSPNHKCNTRIPVLKKGMARRDENEIVPLLPSSSSSRDPLLISVVSLWHVGNFEISNTNYVFNISS